MKYSILFCIALFLTACTDSRKNTTLEIDNSELEVLKSNIEKLKIEKDSLQQLLAKKQDVDDQWFGQMESRGFKKLGIDNPKEYIITELKESPSLISLDGTLGGTMYFTNVQVLGTKWVVASYEDGHIMGRSIFSYKINPETLEIQFNELDSTTEY